MDVLKKYINEENYQYNQQDNSYVTILNFLSEWNFGAKYGQIKRELKVEKLKTKLMKLRDEGMVAYEGRRWVLTKLGKKFLR